MDIQLFNTLTRKKEVFAPIKKGEVGLYCCGPTVYNYAHIGNLRAYLFEDVLVRMFKYNQFKITHVMNITDVGHLTSDADEGEDKMLKGAKREGKTVYEIADHYTKAFFNDTEQLNILHPNVTPKATEHIKQMIVLVKRLEENGLTYVAGGNVYFDTSKFPKYGELARLKLDELKEGARVDKDPNKKNPTDFVLWFTKSKFTDQEMKWDSPWGTGYPGWHIECSAMSMEYLGEQFDIHCGGIDHIPVHHTNEIAQSEGATGKKWVNIWMHNEFLVDEKGKMAKSAGAFLTLSVLKEKGYDPLVYRYFTLGTSYRKPLMLSYDALDGAKNAFENLKKKIIELQKESSEAKKGSEKKFEQYSKDFLAAINDDLNTPKALALLWDVLKDNELKSETKYYLVLDFDRVLGFGLDKVKEEKIDIPDEIKAIAEKRSEARKKKDWGASDQLRDELRKKGWVIEDTKEGYELKKG